MAHTSDSDTNGKCSVYFPINKTSLWSDRWLTLKAVDLRAYLFVIHVYHFSLRWKRWLVYPKLQNCLKNSFSQSKSSDSAVVRGTTNWNKYNNYNHNDRHNNNYETTPAWVPFVLVMGILRGEIGYSCGLRILSPWNNHPKYSSSSR